MEEENQSLTTRKRKRYNWWKMHSTNKAKLSRPSERSLREKSAKIPSPVENRVQQERVETDEEQDKKKRYILFVGNLPFDVKEQDVLRHFKCTGSIKEFRLMTKKTGESKGCGFLEFDNQEGYWKALNLHHSDVTGRKINVEVTCGGGGKGEDREKKLKEKKKKFRRKRKRKSKASKDKSHEERESANTITGDCL